MKQVKLPEELLKEISLRGCMAECFPRMLWQRLFDIYRHELVCGLLSNLDNMLIDFDNCVKLFDTSKEQLTFYWGCFSGHFSTHWHEPVDRGGYDYGKSYVSECDVAVKCAINLFLKKITFEQLEVS